MPSTAPTLTTFLLGASSGGLIPDWLRRLLPNWCEPLLLVAAGAAAVLALFYLVYFGLVLAVPKVAAIARTTAKEGWSQPLFWVTLALGAVLLLLFIVIPYFTFGEDIKMLKDTGLTLITVLSTVLGVWTASVSIADEIEGRTALTLLSKPIGRRQFIFGKFLGVLAPVFVMFLVLGVVFLGTVSYKVAYDARESSQGQPSQEQYEEEIVQVVPGLVLAFFETVVLASLSVAISTRLPMLANMVLCGAIFVMGHLTPLLVQSSVGKLPLVTFVGQLIATLLPNLDHFNIQAAVATGRMVPLDYLLAAFAYSSLYSAIAMLVALTMFEHRDLA